MSEVNARLLALNLYEKGGGVKRAAGLKELIVMWENERILR